MFLSAHAMCPSSIPKEKLLLDMYDRIKQVDLVQDDFRVISIIPNYTYIDVY